MESILLLLLAVAARGAVAANHTIRLGYQVVAVDSLSAPEYDGILVVAYNASSDKSIPQEIRDVLAQAGALDNNFEEEISAHRISLPARRLIYSPVGPLNPDYHDVRSFAEAARKGITRGVKAGMKSPLLVIGSYPTFPQVQLVTLLGALEGLYVNIQYREDCPSKHPKVKVLGVNTAAVSNVGKLIDLAVALESGRIVARDIGGADPERMTPARVEEYVRQTFASSPNIKIEVISDEKVIDKEYPLFSAVNRAASVIERHKGRIIYLTYEGPSVNETLLIVGKGVTYDTGGADIKAGGIMAGMSRDKCGAASVAGFMKVLSLLKPANLKVVGALSMVRNSVGENCYVSDEMITSRAGKRVRVGNTDAEGRMILADVLCYMKELAQNEVNPHLFTIATLTGHAFRTVGPGYTIAMDNGPARSKSFSQRLQKSGDVIGDMFEVSTIRREDYDTHKGKVEGEDVVQALNLPSVQSKRGHQGPAAFLILAAGLDNHGTDSEQPLPFTHIDIAASSAIFVFPEIVPGAPILALSSNYLNLQSE